MDTSDWIATAALLVSIVTAALTLRFTRIGVHDAAYQAATALFLEVDRALLEYPEVRCFFYEGSPMPRQDPRQDRAAVIAETMLDVFEWIWHRRAKLSKQNRDGWEAYIRDMLERSEVLRNYHCNNRHWHPLIDKLMPAA